MVSFDKSRFAVACDEIKTNGNFKLAGMLNLKLKEKAAFTAKQGIQHVHASRALMCFRRSIFRNIRRKLRNDPRIHIVELLHLLYICSMIVRCGLFDLA